MKSKIHEIELQTIKIMSKKLIALCMLFVFSTALFAQETKAKIKKAAAKTEKAIEKAADKTDKAVKNGAAKTKEAANKTADKTEKAATKAADKTKETASKIKKDGTPDKRFKDNDVKEVKATKTKVKKTAAEEKEDLKETAASKSAEKKVKDKVTGSYKGKKVYTGPRGGTYYINKNGNKTYISDDK
jgi:colicin import membrane protein